MHVATAVDLHRQATRGTKILDLIKDQLRTEIRRHQIGYSVGDQRFELRVKSKRRPQIAGRLRLPSAPVPCPINREV
jgi:hypothetical protein